MKDYMYNCYGKLYFYIFICNLNIWCFIYLFVVLFLFVWKNVRLIFEVNFIFFFVLLCLIKYVLRKYVLSLVLGSNIWEIFLEFWSYKVDWVYFSLLMGM